MPKAYPSLPCVNSALQETRDYTFRGNTFGQAGAYHVITDEDREIASRFNVAQAIQEAEQAKASTKKE